jgi:RNA polymerase sigma factor (sigma-70 family)
VSIDADLDELPDAALITAVRAGDQDAYGVLYQRHLHSAKRAATCLAHSQAEREDLVADAFLKVLRALRDGGGPTEEFRAYLLTTMRNAAISRSRGASVSLYAEVPEKYLPGPSGDAELNHWNAATAATAFASLPERWRTVLWHTEVEEESPAEIAPLLGMRPNGVAALAYRAREGLRQAYLKAHLAEVEGRECRATASKLAGWVRKSVPVPLGRKISRHLAVCADCRDRAETLSRVNEELSASILATVLVAPPVSGALKSLLAKIGIAAAITAAAVTTVASSPAVTSPQRVPVPVLADPHTATDSIKGPVTTTPAVPVVPPSQTPAAVTTQPSSTSAETKASTKAEAKADKQAAKAEKKAEKQEAKESRKAEKGK